MKQLAKILAFIFSFTMIYNSQNNNIYANPNVNSRSIVNAAVLLYDYSNPYIALIKQALEDIQNKNPDKIVFSFFDGEDNKAIQNANLDKATKSRYDLILINLVDPTESTIQNVVDRASQRNIPIILFYVSPPENLSNIKTYKKVIFITTDPKQTGTLQGQIIIDEWNKNKKILDRNNDNVLQYVVFQGETNNLMANDRLKYAISAIEDEGIKTQKLALITCNWNEECAKNATESLIFKYGNKIEAILSNNDSMAVGAVKALQKYGYNTGDKNKYTPVVGTGGTPESKELIKKGFMTGTVLIEPSDWAKALYAVGLNLVYNHPPLENTDYKFDETGITFSIPYTKYISPE